MKTEDQRIAIAQAVLGGRWYTNPSGVSYLRFDDDRSKDRTLDQLPGYLNDLNAMHEAEEMLTEQQRFAYLKEINGRYMGGAYGTGPGFHDWWKTTHATAAERAEAFLRTIGKWTEAPTTQPATPKP